MLAIDKRDLKFIEDLAEISPASEFTHRSSSGQTVLMTVCNQLFYNYTYKKEVVVRILLRNYAAKIDVPGSTATVADMVADMVNIVDNYGWNALMYACDFGDLEVVELLLIHGARINQRNNLGQTILHILHRYENAEMRWAKTRIFDMIRARCDISEIADVRNIEGHTYLEVDLD